MREPRNDHGNDSYNCAGAERNAQPTDAADVLTKNECHDDGRRCRDPARASHSSWNQVSDLRHRVFEILQSADVAGRHFQCSADDELPDEEEWQHAAPAIAAKNFAKKMIGSTAARQ